MGRTPPNCIALDYGRRRVGVAGCVKGVSVAFGITTLIIRDLDDLCKQLDPILKERSIEEIILGFPLTLKDTPGTLKEEVLTLFDQLTDRGFVVRLVDEALSSKKAAGLLRKRKRKSQKEDFDRASAALILQEFLDGKLPPLSIEEISKYRTEANKS